MGASTHLRRRWRRELLLGPAPQLRRLRILVPFVPVVTGNSSIRLTYAAGTLNGGELARQNADELVARHRCARRRAGRNATATSPPRPGPRPDHLGGRRRRDASTETARSRPAPPGSRAAAERRRRGRCRRRNRASSSARTKVAGAKPAVIGERAADGVVVPEVPADDVVAPELELAGGSGRARVAGLRIDRANLDLRRTPPIRHRGAARAGRARPAR